MSMNADKPTITRVYDLLEAHGGMTACAIAEMLQLKYGCVYATIQRERRNGRGATNRRIVVRNAPLSGTRRVRDIVFGVERIDEGKLTVDCGVSREHAMQSSVAGIDRWLEAKLRELRKERGNPFAWWLTKTPAKR